MKRITATLLCPFLLLGSLVAQDSGESVEPANPEKVEQKVELSKDRIEALKQVIEPLAEANQQLQKLREEYERAESEDLKKSLQSQIDAESERLRTLRKNFRSIIGGAEAAEYDGTTDQDLSLDQLMVDLLEPLSRAVRDASASPRELDVLRDKLKSWKSRLNAADTILKRIDKLQANLEGVRLQDEFASARRFWEGRKAECRSQIGVLQAQIAERVARQRPALETLSDSISTFFRNRGLNLILALITGVVVFLLSRKTYKAFRRVSPLHRGNISLASRLVDVVAGLLAVLITLWGVMMVFYVRGDWLLLTLIVLFLIGAIWAGKTSIPPYFEQVRTLLNLGSIRENERVIYEGLPFRVKSLGFLTTLDNPRLQGGEYRIPVRHVMGMISRMPDEKEPWFPTEVDDWVVMSDETYGKVIKQTPEQVVLLKLGGSLKTYPAPEYLAGIPENLSHGYRIATVFGIDYQHQKICTTEVPEIFELAITNALLEKYDKEDIQSVKVEFREAGASSLDYRINLDVSGNLDSRFHVLSRFVSKVCVDVCNEQGWVIPFTQITVHQADPS